MREMLRFVRSNDQPLTLIDACGIVPRLDAGDEPALVAIDGTRLRQVLFNHAIDALSSGGNIEIAVRTGRSRVEILVTDDGTGIAAADRECIFVPFYSTKVSGTGLGLALARKFIEEVGGVIRCEDSPRGHG